LTKKDLFLKISLFSFFNYLLLNSIFSINLILP
jgi:hypothetical protein